MARTPTEAAVAAADPADPANPADQVADWRREAACLPHDSELFFPARTAYRGDEVARAKAVCRRCPVREECLRAAMNGREKIGIWGGLTPAERARLHRSARRRPEVDGSPLAAPEDAAAAQVGALDGKRLVVARF